MSQPTAEHVLPPKREPVGNGSLAAVAGTFARDMSPIRYGVIT
jgi:hypothetical protein